MKLIKLLIPIALLAFTTTGFAQGKVITKDEVKSEVKEMKAKHLDKKRKKAKDQDRPQPDRPRVKKPRTGGVMPAPKGERDEDKPRVLPGKPKKPVLNKPTVTPGKPAPGKPTVTPGKPAPGKPTVKPRPVDGKPGKGLGKGDVRPGHGHGDANHNHSGPKGKNNDGIRPGHQNTGGVKPSPSKPRIDRDRTIGMGTGKSTPNIDKATVKGKDKADKTTAVITEAEREVKVYKDKVQVAKDKVMAELKKNPNSKELKDKLDRVKQAEVKVQKMEMDLIQERKTVSETKKTLSIE